MSCTVLWRLTVLLRVEGVRQLVKAPMVPLRILSTRVFEMRTATGREHFACHGSGVSQILKLIIYNGENILNNVNVVL